MLAGWRVVLASGFERPIDGHVRRAGNEKFFRWKTRDHFVAGLSDDNFFLDARRTPAVLGRPERLEREHHPRLDFMRMLERHQPADHRLFPDRQANPVAKLQRT